MHGYAEHPTQKPEAVIEPLLRYVCPPGGIVLDPFCGSGSTGCVARDLGLHFVGMDLNPEYVTLARDRLAKQ
jgi:site-specific DNA-methyltransferase (adenine-specific)